MILRSRPVSYTHLDVYKRQGYSLFECYRLIPAALSAEIIDMGSYIGNLVLQYLFVALGAIPTVIGKMKEKKEEGIIARLN